MDKKRMMVSMAVTAAMLAMLTACGGDTAALAPDQSNEVTEAVTDDTGKTEAADEPAEALEEDGMGDVIDDEEASDIGSEEDQYKQAYLEEAKTLLDAGDADQFAFVNLDGDDIPEFVAKSVKLAFGIRIVGIVAHSLTPFPKYIRRKRKKKQVKQENQ